VKDAEFEVEGGLSDHEGDRVVISVRPEEAHLSLDETAADNALAGTVVFVRDLGELFECYVDCGLEQNVVVAGSPRERVAVEQGDGVWVRFPPEACVVVRA
jgi:putative spermidine/putrescine transport system ATP-binding protein